MQQLTPDFFSVIHPAQQPVLSKIEEGIPFWGYLNTYELRSRYVLAAHFINATGLLNVVEIGGYQFCIDDYWHPASVNPRATCTVYSLDREFLAYNLPAYQTYGHVQHVRDYFQRCKHPTEPYALVALGIDIDGPLDPFVEWVQRSSLAILEYAPNHIKSAELVRRALAETPHKVVARIEFDFSTSSNVMEAPGLCTPYPLREMIIINPEV